MRKRLVAASSAAALLVATGGATAMQAAADTAAPVTSSSTDPSRAVSKGTSIPPIVGYSDQEVVQLLAAGQGSIADTNPDLVKMLGFSPDKPVTDPAELDRIIADYLAATPTFGDLVTVPLQSGDPVAVDAALQEFSKSFLSFLEERYGEFVPPETAADQPGWLYMGAYVAIYANAVGVANAGVYANVGIATFALATAGIVYFYLEDGSPNGTEFEKEHLVAEFTEALRTGSR